MLASYIIITLLPDWETIQDLNNLLVEFLPQDSLGSTGAVKGALPSYNKVSHFNHTQYVNEYKDTLSSAIGSDSDHMSSFLFVQVLFKLQNLMMLILNQYENGMEISGENSK